MNDNLYIQVVDDFVFIINNMKVKMTYKLEWAKAILEICYLDFYNTDLEIQMSRISELFFKYYFNELTTFNLTHGPLTQTPTIELIVRDALSLSSLHNIRQFSSIKDNQTLYFSVEKY